MNAYRSIRHPIVIAIAVLWVLGWVFFVVQSNDGALLLSLLLSLAFCGAILASIGMLIRDWGTQSWFAAGPLVICAAAVPIALTGGEAAQRNQFSVNLPTYEKLVARADVQALQPGEHIKRLNLASADGRGIEWAAAQRTSNGTLVVEFQTASGFLHHAGYVYTSAEAISQEFATQYRWPYQNLVQEHWLEVSN
jgi:hypothetical protein